jgi:hypothetical protein
MNMMLSNKKFFLAAAISVSLFAFSGGIYAQVTNDQVAAMPAPPMAMPPAAKNVPATASNVPDAQLMNVINQTSNVSASSAVEQPIVKPAAKPKAAPAVHAPSAKPVAAHAAKSAAPAPTAPEAAPMKGNQTQIELDLNKKVAYKIFYLNKPDRLVIDIKDSSFSAEFDKSAFANSPIKNIRTAHRSEGNFRIVFDLKEPVTFQHSEQPGSSGPESMKLVIGISPK